MEPHVLPTARQCKERTSLSTYCLSWQIRNAVLKVLRFYIKRVLLLLWLAQNNKQYCALRPSLSRFMETIIKWSIKLQQSKEPVTFCAGKLLSLYAGEDIIDNRKAKDFPKDTIGHKNMFSQKQLIRYAHCYSLLSDSSFPSESVSLLQ